MRYTKRVLVALTALMTTGLMACAHERVDTPVESGESSLFTGATGPISHESLDDMPEVKSGTTSEVPPVRANQHSSIKTPKSADFGSPTGTSSGSGATP